MEPHLHNKIFDSTSCLSEEQLLKYGNNALSQKEKHKIEKHLLECGLCSDALEGFAIVPTSTEMNELRSSIQHITSCEKSVSTIQWKRFLLAASIIGIAFISFYFIFQKNKIARRKSLAENIHREQTLLLAPPMSDELSMGPKDENKVPSDKTLAEEAGIPKEEENTSTPRGGGVMNGIKNSFQTMVTDKLTDENNSATGKDFIPINAEIADTGISDNKALEKEYFVAGNSFEGKKENSQTEFRQSEEEKLTVSEDKTVRDNENFMGTESKLQPASQSLAMDEDVSKNYKHEDSDNRKKSSESSKSAGKSAPAKKAHVKYAASKVKYIENHKVLDYSGEDIAVSAPESINIPAQFENSEKAKAAEVEQQIQTKNLLYDDVLKEGLLFLEANNYPPALEKFNLILKNTPDDLNATFYSGLVYYHLGNYDKALSNFDAVTSTGNSAFYDEGNWYKALTYQKKNEPAKARALFRDISARENFYKKGASEMLYEMEKK